MLFFFKSSKKSPIASPTEPPKSDEHVQRGADDFVMIGAGGPNPIQQPVPLYPPVPTTTPNHSQFSRQFSIQQSNYTQNIPFKLNAALTSESTSDIFEYKLREINQLISQLENIRDYDFRLERSIVEQS